MSNQLWPKVHGILLELRDSGNREHLQGTSREPSRLRFCWKICAKYLLFHQSDRKCTYCSRKHDSQQEVLHVFVSYHLKKLMSWPSLQPSDFLISSTHWPCRLLGAKTKVARLGTKPPNSVHVESHGGDMKRKPCKVIEQKVCAPLYGIGTRGIGSSCGAKAYAYSWCVGFSKTISLW